MDLWVVAVAASAGCLAKYWRNLSKNTNSLPELSPGDSNCGKPESPGNPFHRLAHIKKLGDGVSTEKKWISDERVSDIYQADDASTAEVASTSGFDVEKLGYLDKYDHNVLSVLSVLPKTSTNDVLEHEAGNGLCGDISDNCGNSLVGPSAGMGSFHGSSRNRSSLRPKCNEHFIKPLSSLESCLMAQLYKEHAKMENYEFSSLPSPSAPTTRPPLGTSGSQILGRGNDCCFSAPIGFVEDKMLEEACLGRNENVSGIPPLPKIGSLEFLSQMKRTRKDGNGRLSSSIKMVSVKNTLSQGGSQDGINLFCLGIYFGLLSSFKTNKREVDSLKEKLKQTQNFVQDLQDELDMKDSMIVKELANESYKSQDTCDNSYDRTLTAASPELSIDISTKYDGKKLYDQSVEESSEPMSKIEAELEAELERLELNMNASSLDRRFSDLVELDPEFVADFAQGELRADMIHGQAVAQPKSNQDVGDTSTTHSGNYAVSPRELSLRLHEVIQSRLEEHVQELEAALQNSQRQLNRMESVRTSWNGFSSYEQGYSSSPESSIAQECNPVAQPLIVNLSGETLDAYNEACIEKIKTGDSEYQDLPSRVSENKHQEGFKLSDRHAYTHQNGGIDGSIPHLAIENDISSMEFFSCKKRSFGGHTTEVQELNDVGASEDETSDWDDEFEKQLIKQIVEKSKKGSPVILNAQRVLFLMDEK